MAYMYILVHVTSIYVYMKYILSFKYVTILYQSYYSTSKYIICFIFHCSIFKICAFCAKALGPNTQHHHNNQRKFTNIIICTTHNKLTTAKGHTHRHCTQNINITLEEANANFGKLLRVFHSRNHFSKHKHTYYGYISVSYLLFL